ncbi:MULTISPECIES: tetratricopeptide repeat protein [unclassified Nonomuraea]|uniref:tetratricopeptide repeat protein n=1 Tax=unclassified Nonomuraea TaxID=2593643 RepID=UPI0033D24A12
MSAAGGPGRVIQQAHGAGLARIYQAAGDLIVYGGAEPYRWALWPAPEPPPAAAKARAQPSELLRASHALVDFTGRGALLAELARWRDADPRQDVAVRLIHGPGGQGKTRLAGHVAQRWRQRGWVVLAAHHRRDRSTPEDFEVPAFDGAGGVLVVVDYAERWDTADLLTLLRDTRLPGRMPVRVLLLARPAGTWWDSLNGRIQRDLRLMPSRTALEPLEQEAGISRGRLFAAARDRFAELLQVPGAEAVPAPSGLARHEAYRLVLTVHMAALAAVLAHDRGQAAPADPVQVSEFLLARERDHWEAMASPHREKPLATSPDAMGQIVYTATLTGRLGYEDGRAALTRAEIESTQAAGQLLKDHALCYPPAAAPGPAPGQAASVARAGGMVLEPLYPDRLGEDFLALSTPGHACGFPADPWAEKAPARLLAGLPDTGDGPDGKAPAWARHGLTTLIEAARRWPHLARLQVYPLLAEAPHLAVQAGGAALVALAGLDDIDPRLLETIESTLPKQRQVDLDVGAAAVASRLAEARLAATSDPVARARIHEDLAFRLSFAGLHARAVAEGHQAVWLWYRLAALDWDAHLPDLAMSLSNHAPRLADIGRRAEAAAVSQTAVSVRRKLVALNRDAYLPNLAISLSNHAVRLAEIGRRADALLVSEEALTLYRELAALDRDAHLPRLAMSVSNHAQLSAEMGRRAEAAPLSDEAVRLRRELVALDRGAHLPDLAMSLSNHAIRLAETGQRADALRISEEALLLRRELVAVNRHAYLSDLAMSVDNHAMLLARTGRQAEAASLSREAVSLYRELAARNRDAHLPGLAMSLINNAVLLAETGRRADALRVSEEAVGLSQELVAVNRDAYLPILATSLLNHASRLKETGRAADALRVSAEAVSLYRELAALNRDVYLPNLAASLHNHVRGLVLAGRWGEAVPPAREAARLRQELAALHPDVYLPDHVQSLTVLGYVLGGGTLFREAVVPLAEAFAAGRRLPGDAQGVMDEVVQLLRRAHAGDPVGACEEFRKVTGQDMPDRLKQPPAAEG